MKLLSSFICQFFCNRNLAGRVIHHCLLGIDILRLYASSHVLLTSLYLGAVGEGKGVFNTMNSFFTEDLVFFYSTIKVMKVSYRKEQLFVVVVACFKKKKKFKESIDHVSTQLMKDAVQFSIGTLLFA